MIKHSTQMKFAQKKKKMGKDHLDIKKPILEKVNHRSKTKSTRSSQRMSVQSMCRIVGWTRGRRSDLGLG